MKSQHSLDLQQIDVQLLEFKKGIFAEFILKIQLNEQIENYIELRNQCTKFIYSENGFLNDDLIDTYVLELLQTCIKWFSKRVYPTENLKVERQNLQMYFNASEKLFKETNDFFKSLKLQESEASDILNTCLNGVESNFKDVRAFHLSKHFLIYRLANFTGLVVGFCFRNLLSISIFILLLVISSIFLI